MNSPGYKEHGMANCWEQQSSVHRRDDILNVGLKNFSKAKQRMEKRHFRKREDQLKIQGLEEQSELGELQMVP